MVIDIVDLRQPTECSSERSALLAGLRSGGGDTFMPGVKMQKSLVLIIPMICALAFIGCDDDGSGGEPAPQGGTSTMGGISMGGAAMGGATMGGSGMGGSQPWTVL